MNDTTLYTAIRDQAVSLLRAGKSVNLHGMPGSGRSRLLRAIVKALLPTSSTTRIVEIRGISALRDRPLEPLVVAGLVERRDVAQAPTTIAAAIQAVVDAAHDGLLIVVDDADDLDDASIGVLVAALAAQKGVLLSVTAPRPPSACPRDRLSPMVQPGVRIAVCGLEYVEMGCLITEALDGPVDSALVGRVALASGGLPGLALAIVDGARHAGLLTRTDGVWTTSTTMWTPGLLHTLEPLVSRLSGPATDCMQALSLGGLGNTPKVYGWEALEELDGYGLLRFVPWGEKVAVGVYPPILTERCTRTELGARCLKVNESLTQAQGGAPRPTGQAVAFQAPAALTGDQPQTVAHDSVLNQTLVEHRHRETQECRRAWSACPVARHATAYLRALLATGASPQTLHTVIDGTSRIGESRDLVEFDIWSAFAVGLGDHDDAAARALLARARAGADEWVPLTETAEKHLALLVGRASAPEPVLAVDADQQVARTQVTVCAELLTARGRPAEALEVLGRPGWSEAESGKVQQTTYGLALLMDARLDEALDWSIARLKEARARHDIDLITAHAHVAAVVLHTQGRLPELNRLLTAVLSIGVHSTLQRPAEIGLLSIAASTALLEGRTAVARHLSEQAATLGHSWIPTVIP
ncbi:MAG: hypothetical protein LBU50_01070, partial [Cellulomonas sp.]|nr:hypothetical protein [Cellulomonas sp.]